MYSKKWREFLEREIGEIKNSGRYSEEAVFLTPQKVAVQVKKGGKFYKCLNFCANNYLGLADSKELAGAAADAMKYWGHGMASVRFICGTQKIHKELEQKVAEFLGTEDSIIYTSCFDANAGLFETLLGQEDALIADSLNHASLIDGARLCKAQRFVYQHNDMRDVCVEQAAGKFLKGLEHCLKLARHCPRRIIVTDGVFSMDGEIAKLENICDLAEKYNAMVVVDDSHATGIIGWRGKGTAEWCDVVGRVDIVTGTFGKALGGGVGGFAAGPKEVIEVLRQKSRPYRFSNSLLPAAVGSALKVFEMLTDASKSKKLRKKLSDNTLYFRVKIKELGFEIKGDMHPIVPVMIRDSKLTQEMSDRLLREGILAVAFSYPVVPKNEDRIRVQISAGHTKKHLDAALAAFEKVGKELKII